MLTKCCQQGPGSVLLMGPYYETELLRRFARDPEATLLTSHGDPRLPGLNNHHRDRLTGPGLFVVAIVLAAGFITSGNAPPPEEPPVALAAPDTLVPGGG